MKSVFINPFEKYQENALLSIGFFAMLIGSLIGSYYNARFDGFLDLHFTPYSHFTVVLLDNLINTTSSIIILFGIGKYINSKTRLIDIITTILIGRIPFYLLPFFNTKGYIFSISNQVIEGIQNQPEVLSIAPYSYLVITIFAIVAITAMVWSISLFYNGFKVACNLQTRTQSLMFAGGILLSEIATKTLIYFFN